MITKRLFHVQLVLLAGFGSVFLLPHSTKTSPAGIAMTLPRTVGDWIGDDAQVTAKERETLAKDTQFARKVYYNLAGDQIYVSIVLSGDDMTNSIHRPERCLPAQGWSLQASQKRGLQMGDGKTLPLIKLRTFQTFETFGQRTVVYNVTYYWFIGANEVTSSHLVRTGIDLRDRILHGLDQRWAYLTVAANLSQGVGHPERTEEQTAEMIEKFIQELVPKLRRPDGSALRF
jgi:EpsI family protein